MSERAAPRLALIFNPYAGLGGPLALGGSDTTAASGATGISSGSRDRTLRTLRALIARVPEFPTAIRVLAAPGKMGADAARSLGLTVHELGPRPASDRRTTAADTRACVECAQAAGVDLILFAGGDGTARDVSNSLKADVPILGIPSGVKMHSGVFATSPERAGDAAIDYLLEPSPERLARADIVDRHPSEPRSGRSGTKLYGEALTPRAPGRVLPAKTTHSWNDDNRLLGACASVAEELEREQIHLIGPGTTTSRVLEAAGLRGSLLGVDAVRRGEIIGRDLDESQLIRLLDGGGMAKLVLGVIGGQGMLLGRGNQQLSPTVLKRISPSHIAVLAARDKLLSLNSAKLYVDTGDTTLDAKLRGWLPVRIGRQERLMMEVTT